MADETRLLRITREDCYRRKRNRRDTLSAVGDNHLHRFDTTLLVQFVHHVHATEDRKTKCGQPRNPANEKAFLANQVSESMN